VVPRDTLSSLWGREFFVDRTVIQWDSETVGQWDSETVGQWDSETLGQWDGETVRR